MSPRLPYDLLAPWRPAGTDDLETVNMAASRVLSYTSDPNVFFFMENLRKDDEILVKAWFKLCKSSKDLPKELVSRVSRAHRMAMTTLSRSCVTERLPWGELKSL